MEPDAGDLGGLDTLALDGVGVVVVVNDECSGERGEDLWRDTHHRYFMPLLPWSGVGPEHGHDLFVRLERDEH